MRKIVIERPGGHSAMALVEAPEPDPGPGRVRVRVKAAGINYADCMVRMGLYEAAKGLYPITPGFEFAGEVDAVGRGVDSFEAGARVFGLTRFGAYASSIVVDANMLWRCPGGWGFSECAAFPAVFLTAYYGLFRAAKVEPGETVLVHSAAGGAGSAFLQLARAGGCVPVAVVGSPDKAGLCRELGAETVIVRSESDLWAKAERAAPEGYDAIFDANGVATLRAGFDHLARGGRLVSYGFAEILPRGNDYPGWLSLAWNYLRVPRFSPMDMTMKSRSVMGYNMVYMFDRKALLSKAMDDLFRWIGEGKIRKVPVAEYPLSEAARAHAALESGTTKGKLVLIV